MQIRVNGQVLGLDVSGALHWPAREALVLADLHFEKGSSYARSGTYLPPYDTRTTLTRIERLVAHYRPARVIALGDSFHDMGADDRLDSHERERLSGLAASRDWIWNAGNHEPAPPPWLAGAREQQPEDGRLVFRHAPSTKPPAG